MKKSNFSLSALCLAASMVLSCSSGANADASADSSRELPEIPSSILAPQERAAYVLNHFWDGCDYASYLDTPTDSARLEQDFVNFVQFFEYVPDSIGSIAASSMLDAAKASPSTYRQLQDLGRIYLYERESPYYNEGVYISFLRHDLASGLLADHQRSVAETLLEIALKNRPGDKAADFSFITREGKQSSLYSLPRLPYLLVIFYDPDCEDCEEMIAEVRRRPEIQRLLDNGTVGVLAIDAEDNREEWQQHAKTLPADWTVAFDTSGIIDNETYVYTATPTLYLLDANKRVLLKEATIEQLIDYAQTH